MKYVQKFTPSEDHITHLFGRTGLELTGEDKYKQQHLAKIVTQESNDRTAYYISTHNGTLFDPQGPYGKRRRVLETKMKKVSKNTFDFYMTYLKTNNTIYLTKAQRGFLND